MTVAELHPRFSDNQIRDWQERNGMTDPLMYAEKARMWFVLEAMILEALSDLRGWTIS